MLSAPQKPSSSQNLNSNNSNEFRQQSKILSPIKYLLQSNVKLSMGRQDRRKEEEITVISQLLKGCNVFEQLNIKLEQGNLLKELCNGIVLIYCESPHIMEVKNEEIFIFFEGQGFQYIQNNMETQANKTYKLHENNEYIMMRKISSNDYFISLPENNGRYHALNSKKYQLMVDQNTLIGKISDDLFNKVFMPKIIQRHKQLANFLKNVQSFNGLPNSFYTQFSKFLQEVKFKVDQKVIYRGQKSKYVYFIKAGKVQSRYFPSSRKSVSSIPHPAYYISTGKGCVIQQIGEGQTFGMQQLEVMEAMSDQEVVCLTDCSFYKIEKRVLAIIITSFELEFQHRNKIWTEININSQIQGHNYSPEQQLLTKNVQRIRTSQKKARDLKLRRFISSKAKEDPWASIEKLAKEQNKVERGEPLLETMQQSRLMSPDDKRRMIKTTDGRFRSTNVTKLVNTLGSTIDVIGQDKNRKQLEITNRKDSNQEQLMNTFEIVTIETEEKKNPPLMRLSNAFEYCAKLQNAKLIRSNSQSSRQSSSTKRFVPRIQAKSGEREKNQDRYKADLVGVFLDKKIKNEMLKKAQKVLHLNQNQKLNQNKHLKRLFSSRDCKLNTISQCDKKNIASDIIERMSNLKDNPLLLQIESERRKVQRQLKLIQRRPKALEQSPRKYKKEDELILIKNNQ